MEFDSFEHTVLKLTILGGWEKITPDGAFGHKFTLTHHYLVRNQGFS